MVLKSILVHTVYHKAVAQISQLLRIKLEKSLKNHFPQSRLFDNV